MIKSITRGLSGGDPEAVTEVSGYGGDVHVIVSDLRNAFRYLGQEEGGGLVIRAGADVLGVLGLKQVREGDREIAKPVRYCGALCFLRENFNSADWWTVSRDMPTSSSAPEPGLDQPQSQEDPVVISADLGYVSYPPDAAQIKQGLQKSFADIGSPLGDGLVISASSSALKAMLDLNLIKWGNAIDSRYFRVDNPGGLPSRFFLNARVVKDHTLGADIWRVAPEADQQDSPKMTSQGVAALGTSVGAAIEGLQQWDDLSRPQGDNLPHPQGLPPIPGDWLPRENKAEVMIRTYEGLISHETLETTLRSRVKRHLMNWTTSPEKQILAPALSVQEALARIAKEDELAAAQHREESLIENGDRLLTDPPAPDLVDAFDEVAPDGEPKDPRAGPAAMLRSEMKYLIVSMREQNARESVKCRDLSMAISHVEDAYLRLGAMADPSLLDFKE